jgi:hypothetical protein
VVKYKRWQIFTGYQEDNWADSTAYEVLESGGGCTIYKIRKPKLQKETRLKKLCTERVNAVIAV